MPSLKTPAGAVFSTGHPLLGGGIRTGQAYICWILHMKTTKKLNLNMLQVHLSTETIYRSSQSRETIPLMLDRELCKLWCSLASLLCTVFYVIMRLFNVTAAQNFTHTGFTVNNYF
jgi:hypothetical protein